MSDTPTDPLPPPPVGPPHVSSPPGAASFWSRRGGFLVIGLVVGGIVGGSIGAGAAPKPADLSGALKRTRTDLTAARADTSTAQSELKTANARVSMLEAQLAAMQSELDQVKASKIKTVVKTKTVTKTVPKWVPNGNGIEVDLTGYEGEIEIHDVQITHAYGHTSVVGIAINRTGTKVSYVELGCSLLSSSGKLLANAITNQTDWPAGASWGFDCVEQTDASGAVLRVDSLG